MEERSRAAAAAAEKKSSGAAEATNEKFIAVHKQYMQQEQRSIALRDELMQKLMSVKDHSKMGEKREEKKAIEKMEERSRAAAAAAEKKSPGAAEATNEKFIAVHKQYQQEQRSFALRNELKQKLMSMKDHPNIGEIREEIKAIEKELEKVDPFERRLGYSTKRDEGIKMREIEENLKRELAAKWEKYRNEKDESKKKGLLKGVTLASAALDEHLEKQKGLVARPKKGKEKAEVIAQPKRPAAGPEQSKKGKEIAQPKTILLSPIQEHSVKHGSKREEERKGIAAAAAKLKLDPKREEERKGIAAAAAKPKLDPKREEKGKSSTGQTLESLFLQDKNKEKSSTSQTLGSLLEGGKKKGKEEKRRAGQK